MNFNKAIEQLDDIRSSESFEEYFSRNREEIYEILHEKSEELIKEGKSNVEQAVMDYFIGIIEEKAHGRKDVIRNIYIITDGAGGVNFEDKLDIPEDSVVAGKIEKGIKIFQEAKKCKDTIKKAYGWYKDIEELDSLRRDDGTYGQEGKEKLEDILYKFIDEAGGIVDKIPAAGLYGPVMKACFDCLGEMLPEVIKTAKDHERRNQLSFMASEYVESDPELYAKLAYLAEEVDWNKEYSDSEYIKVFSCGPTYDELVKVIDDFPEQTCLNHYLEWRYAYDSQVLFEEYLDSLVARERARQLRLNEQYLDAAYLEIEQFMIENDIPLAGEAEEDEELKFYTPHELKTSSHKGEKVDTQAYSSTFGNPSAPPFGGTGTVYITRPSTHIDTHNVTPAGFYSYIENMYKNDPEGAREFFSEFMDKYKESREYIDEDDEYKDEMDKIMEELLEKYPDLGGDEYDTAQEVTPPRDPLVIDLGTPGIQLTSVENGVHFDLDKNGFAEKTAWIGKEDGLLVIDRNHNGFIDDGGELFSDQVVMSDGNTSSSGFVALKEFDDNVDEETGQIGDGTIDEKDSRFSELRVWVDANQNGISEKEELKKLDKVGIESISLEHIDKNTIDPETGTAVTEASKVTFKNGEVREVSEHWFSVKNHDTEERDDEGNKIVADSVESFGNVKNLSSAINDDETGVLGALVEAFKESANYFEKRVLIKKILFAITDSTELDINSRGGKIDARELRVIERFMGEDFIGADGSSTPNTVAAPILKNVYSKIENMYFNLLNKETMVGSYLSMISAKADETGRRELDYSLFNYIIGLDISSGLDVDDVVYGVASWLKEYDAVYKTSELAAYTERFASVTERFVNIADVVNVSEVRFGSGSDETVNGTGSDDIIWSDAGNDIVNAGSGDDIIFGSTGDDKLNGGAGDDLYYIGKNHGNDVIHDTEGNSKVVFTDGASREDYATSVNADLGFVFTNKDTGETVSAPDLIRDPLKYNIVFEGSDPDENEFQNAEILNGTADGDDIEGGDGFNIFYGGEGSDTLAGGKDIDFMYGGEGDDTLLGRNGTNVMYGEGGNDIIYDGDDSGYLSGGADDDKLYGGGGADVLDGGAGNDYLQGDHGNDTYIFGKGYDEDTIAASSDLHTIIIHDYTPGQMHCVRYQNNDLVIDFGYNNTDKITVKRFFDFNANRDYNFVFDNGTVLGQHDIVAESAPIVGTDGNDYLYATDGNDTLDGGAGNDTLCGAGGTDKYIFGKGYGADSINEWGSDKSTIILKDIKSDEVTFADQWGSNLQILVNDSEDVLTVSNFKWGQATYEFEFADGAKGYVDKSTWKFVFTKEPDPVEEDTEQAAAELLDTLYSDTADIGSDLLTENTDTVISELTESASAGEESISDITDIQAMILAENMSAFSDDSQISDTMDIADITADSSALGQLLVNSAQ